MLRQAPCRAPGSPAAVSLGIRHLHRQVFELPASSGTLFALEVSQESMPPANADRAVIEPQKLRGYLLSRTHPVGRFKAIFFRSLGYSASRWQRLEADLRAHLLANDAAFDEGLPSAASTSFVVPFVDPTAAKLRSSPSGSFSPGTPSLTS